VPTARVIEAVDVLEDGGLGLSAGFPGAPPDQLRLDGLEEGLNGGVVIAVSFAAHRRLQAVLAQHLLVVV
jgi:hypothetical protein